MMVMLLTTRPTLSDDVYRYVWEGRLQAQGISPYLYAPDAPELDALRDTDIWPHINHKMAVTVYPPGAELAFALLWRALPANLRWFQAAMALGALLAGGLLARLLHDLGRPPARLLIYLWSPLLIFETAHSAHVDGLVLPLLVGAWWARVRERDTATGVLLGLATAVKFYPAILLPALWRPQHRQARWRMPLAFALTLTAAYLPYVLTNGPAVLGYLPKYFEMRFNMGLASLLIPEFERAGVDPNQGILVLTLAVLALLSAWMVWRPAPDGESALRRCIWLIGAVTLLTQNLFPWYLLWLLPLVAIFLQPGRLLGLRPDAWTGWWLFTGLVGLSYTFFISWKPVPWAQWAQFVPLYGLLLADLVRRLRTKSAELAA
jgi:alpha-1,6-mannosyltransferase